MLQHIVHRADEGMIQCRGGARFAQKKTARCVVVDAIRRDEFHRDGAVQFFVVSGEDRAHSAFTEFAGDAVLTDALVEHAWSVRSSTPVRKESA